jgi:Predicted Zn-dependent peptidases
MKRLITVLALGLWSLTSQASLPTHAFTLDNGLKVLVREDHRAPVVTVMMWYKAGSIDEAPYETGLAHVLEHMMFKGTERLGPGDFSKLSPDMVVAIMLLPATTTLPTFSNTKCHALLLGLDLEADRVGAL